MTVLAISGRYQADQCAAEVLSLAEEFVLQNSSNPQQRRLMETALQYLHREAGELELPPFVHLPLLVYAALRGDHRPAIPLAVATTLLFLGLDIIDDLAYGDLTPEWDRFRPA